MRPWLAAVVILGIVLVGGRDARANEEKVKANQSAELYAEAGESSRILTTIKEGQAMKVIKREGRWLRVRVKGRTGWIPRSKVDEMDGAGGITRNTRRRPFVDGRSTGRGFTGGAPDDRVGMDAVDRGDDDDNDRGDKDDDDDDNDDRGRRRDRDDDDDDDRGRSRDRDDDDDDDRASRDDDDRDDDDRDDDEGRDNDDAEQEQERPTVKIKSKRVTLYAEPSKKSD